MNLILSKKSKNQFLTFKHPWSIHYQAFLEIFKVAFSSFNHCGQNSSQFWCKHVCVIRFLCLSCNFIQHLWLHLKKKAQSSTSVDLRYIYVAFILVFIIFHSRLIMLHIGWYVVIDVNICGDCWKVLLTYFSVYSSNAVWLEWVDLACVL